jgi:hypothetical protein
VAEKHCSPYNGWEAKEKKEKTHSRVQAART